jgi:hypothetical protein
MPQFDTFIFSSNLYYFTIAFLILLYLNITLILPKFGALLKLRFKLLLSKTGDIMINIKPKNTLLFLRFFLREDLFLNLQNASIKYEKSI